MNKYVSEVLHRLCRSEAVREADALVTRLVEGHMRILSREWPRVRPDRDERSCPYCFVREGLGPHDDRCALRISCEAMGYPLPDAWAVASQLTRETTTQ